MKRIIILTAISTAMITACSSSPELNQVQNMPDKVISRINDMSSRPSWLSEDQPFDIKNGFVTSLGQVTISGNDRIEAAYTISDNNAKGAICSAIESRLSFILQNAEEGTSLESTQVRRIGAEACQITTSSIRPGNRYWEKILTSTDNGERTTRYKVFSTVSIPETDFKRAVINAIRKQEGKGGLSQNFSKKVDEHWDKFTQSE